MVSVRSCLILGCDVYLHWHSEARRTGVVVWDCVAKELVLVIPWILAFLGDNPMSSEFASHIGMQGKCFCRKCKVRGADTKNRPAGEAGEKERLEDFLNVRIQVACGVSNAEDLLEAIGWPSGSHESADNPGLGRPARTGPRRRTQWRR